MTGVIVGVADVAGTFGWLAVWLTLLVCGVVCIFRGRSGAGACLGVAAILGLGLQICGGSVYRTIGLSLDVLPWSLGWTVAAFVRSLGDTVLYALLVAAAVLQRPPRS